jgi:HEAT repeat protein
MAERALEDGNAEVRAAAARALAKDSDPQTSKALVRAVSDNSWIMRRKPWRQSLRGPTRHF